MPMSPREMIRYLQTKGFTIVSQNGSHVKLKNMDTKKQTIVPCHSSRSLPKGLEQEILKQAGLK